MAALNIFSPEVCYILLGALSRWNRGNEIADKEAKAACISDRIDLPQMLHKDFYGSIKSYTRQKWQDRWASPLLANNKKYKKIRENVKPWSSSFNANRKVEVVLSRLRIGHTFLTHKFLLEGGSAPECARCDEILSVEHILVHCQQYNALRRNNGLAGKSIKEILNDDADILAVIKFLKEINIFNKV